MNAMDDRMTGSCTCVILIDAMKEDFYYYPNQNARLIWPKISFVIKL